MQSLGQRPSQGPKRPRAVLMGRRRSLGHLPNQSGRVHSTCNLLKRKQSVKSTLDLQSSEKRLDHVLLIQQFVLQHTTEVQCNVYSQAPYVSEMQQCVITPPRILNPRRSKVKLHMCSNPEASYVLYNAMFAICSDGHAGNSIWLCPKGTARF